MLEQDVADLQERLRAQVLATGEEDDDVKQWKTRFEAQMQLNMDLREQKSELERHRAALQDGIKEEKRNNVHLIEKTLSEYKDFTELQLKNELKALDREKVNLISTHKHLLYQVDKESKDFHKHDEVRRAYGADITMANRELDHLRAVRRLTDGPQSPITSPASLRWNNRDGIVSDQRILDASMGPVNKRNTVRNLQAMPDRDQDERSKSRAKSRADGSGGHPRNLPKMERSARKTEDSEPRTRDK